MIQIAPGWSVASKLIQPKPEVQVIGHSIVFTSHCSDDRLESDDYVIYRPSKHQGERLRMISGRSNIKVQVPKFSDGSLFESWNTFEVAWKSYCARNLLHYRLRSSESAEKNNQKYVHKGYITHCTGLTMLCCILLDVSRRLAGKYHYVKFHIPPKAFTEAMRVYYCTHGCCDGSRGKGFRDHRHFRFAAAPLG